MRFLLFVGNEKFQIREQRVALAFESLPVALAWAGRLAKGHASPDVEVRVRDESGTTCAVVGKRKLVIGSSA